MYIFEVLYIALLIYLVQKRVQMWHLHNFSISVFRPHKIQQCNTINISNKTVQIWHILAFISSKNI